MRDLLLLLCRYPFEEKNRETLSKLLDEVMDWPALVKLINDHGIIALAAYNIKEARLGKNIPAEAMTVLENGYLRSVARNTWLTERWKEVNTILCHAGIKHILLKGMALEHTLYGSRGLRQMNDNDILIRHEESLIAWQLLQKEGFTIEPPKSPLFRKIRAHINQHLPTLYKNGYVIEIHDKLFENSKTEEKSNSDPFSDTLEINIGNIKAFILSEEIHLKYLISHFEQHAIAGDCQLRLYNDIILLDRFNSLKMPDRFISDPMQGNKKEFRKAAYKARISSMNPKYRFLFILGDTFPSLKWMQKRYNCSVVTAVLRYPIRIGKLLWLIN
jgi:hypothetical protein